MGISAGVLAAGAALLAGGAGRTRLDAAAIGRAAGAKPTTTPDGWSGSAGPAPM
jgi:hypothetical protein